RRIIFRHKWLILSLVILVLPIATIQAYRVKPIYQATATIDIRPETSSLSKDVILVESSDNTKAEMVIIKSLPLVRQVVESLNLDKNPRFLDVSSKRTILEALKSISGGRPEKEKTLLLRAKHPNAAEKKTGQEKSPADRLEEIPDAQSERIRLEPYIQTVLGNLSVEGVRDTRLVRISFQHTDPEIAADVANGIADNFITYNFKTKTDRFTNTSNWLDLSTRKLKTQVEMAERTLADYTAKNGIFSPEGKENLTADKLVQLHDKVMRAETDRILKESLYEEVKLGRVAQLPEAFSDPKIAELKKSYNELAVTASQLSVKFGAKNPRYQEVQQQMATLQEQINANQKSLEERLKADYERAVREENSLKAALEETKNAAVQQNQAFIEFSVLKQDLDTAKALYTEFLNKTNTTDIQKAEQYNNVRLIESAEPPNGPIGPNRNQTIMLGLVISLVLGVGLAYIIETLNTTIRTVEDVNRATQLPLLAVIPTLTDIPQKNMPQRKNGIRELKTAVMKDMDDAFEMLHDYADKSVLVNSMKMFSAAAEAYRILRTSILFSTAGQPPKTLLVTSGQPGDGKTTTVFNLALALTQLQADVVIVDCDMRRPRVHKMLQLEKREGLSSFLTSGGDLDRFLYPGPVRHLSILPCGFIPPNPSELISSENMKELLHALEERFDYVILDSPPLATVTDPIILSTLVDGVILVVKSGQSKSELVSRVSLYLNSVGAKVLGITLNNLNIRKDGYDYYRHYRDYSSYIDQETRKRAGE
ncbi:MAG: polysaccharide biosynthesis tyrosine autokinase, partial [Blastocatellia bacterium]|nr:polysaccharide biosynthesis tyrosine autokinase [Blastocatellia bacterium]